jgi:hypothetical protein
MISLFPGNNKVYSLYSNSNTGVLLNSAFDTESISSLYMVNAVGAVAPHWLGIISGGSFTAVPALGAPMLIAFRNPGTAGFQLVLDRNYFADLTLRGFKLVRSNNPGNWTQVPGTLANPVDIQIIARPTGTKH